MAEVAEDQQHGDALPLGPESLVWRYFGDNRMYLIGPRPAVLQNMLAELGQGVLDHSVFFADTSARITRSIRRRITGHMRRSSSRCCTSPTRSSNA